MNRLEILPKEALCEIASQLSNKDFARLRMVSNKIKCITNYVWQYPIIKVGDKFSRNEWLRYNNYYKYEIEVNSVYRKKGRLYVTFIRNNERKTVESAMICRDFSSGKIYFNWTSEIKGANVNDRKFHYERKRLYLRI